MPEFETQAIIALGANQPSEQGGPAETLEAALALLQARGISVVNRSRWVSSPAWPAGSGPDYVNGAALVSAPLSPAALLAMLHKVETMLGRQRKSGERWAARPCDLDLIACGSAVMPGAEAWRHMTSAAPETVRETLILPHPQMQTRAFVLVPMMDVAAEWRHPMLGKTVAEMVSALPAEDRDAVTPV